MPEHVEEQKAVFRTKILEVAKVILSREYPTTGTLATLPAFERPSHCRLDFIGSNISVYFYNPGVRALVGWDVDSWKSQPEEPDIWRRRLCLCLCAAQCSCPTVGMGCSLSLSAQFLIVPVCSTPVARASATNPVKETCPSTG